MKRIRLKAGFVVSLVLCLFLNAPTAHGGWFTKIVTGVSDVTRSGGKKGVGAGFADISDAARLVKKLPMGERVFALAASVSHEGHWHLMNASGERATVSGTDELERALEWLMKERHQRETGRIVFYISDVSLINNPQFLDFLPTGAGRQIVVGGRAYAIVHKDKGGQKQVFARLRENLDVLLDDVGMLRETCWQVERPFTPGNVRFLSLMEGAAKSVRPRQESGTGAPMKPDFVDPYYLEQALQSLEGQNVFVTGTVNGDLLYFKEAGDGGSSILVSDIKRVAKDLDINLVVLNSDVPRQPGVRDWLWRTTEVSGLTQAFQAKTMGDFLNVLGGARDGFELASEKSGSTHFSLTARPGERPRGLLESGKNTGGGDSIGSVITEVMASIKGDVVVSSVELFLRNSSRQNELDRRFFSAVPSSLQYGYLGLLALGVLGLPVANRWWQRIWPPEKREEYRTPAALWSAMAVRRVLFVALFLPIAGLPAFWLQLGYLARRTVLLPYKWFARRSVE